MMGGYGYSSGGGTWGILGLVLNLLFVLLVIVGVILLIWWLARLFAPGAASHHTSSNALEALKERYAKGEISRQDFEQMKKDIGG